MDRYSIRHEEQAASRDADQAEKVAYLTGSAVIDAGVRDDIIAEAIEDDEFDPDLVGLDDVNPGRERWHRQDLGVEGSVSAALQEVERRSAFLGAGYPFSVDKGTLTYRGSLSKFYEYCLGISVAPNVTTGDYVQLPRTFERVVALIAKLYMGSHAEHFHAGHPRDAGLETWYAAMQALHAHSKEFWWCPEEGLPIEPTVGGDGGIDFVVWKKPLDPRPGALFVVGQCACGGNWDQKLDDLSLKALSAWFHPISWIEAIRAFATPFSLSDGNFQIAHKRAGWVLDRVRLTAMAEALHADPEYVAWQATLSEMTDLSLRQAA